MNKALYRRVVPETYVQLLYEYMESQGHNPEQVLGHPWPVPSPSGIGGLNVEVWASLLETAQSFLKCPSLALEVAKTITPRHLGVLGAVLLASNNLGAALLRFEQYQRLIFDVNPMEFRFTESTCELVWDVSEFRVRSIVEQLGFAVTLHFSRVVTRGDISCRQVRFSGEPPGDVAAFEAFFNCPVLFNDPQPGFIFDQSILALPLRSADPSMIEMLEQHANQLLDKLPKQEEIVEQVRREIARSLREGEPDIQKISERLHCSSRTLQRRLMAANTQFRHEVGVVRLQLANDYLKDRRLKIVDIALLLGYSEHSAFTRAYKEWTGLSPHDVREDVVAV
ncbi:MAG TPA: AraC family transcriptional regulator ligand-binding domain-containing protein [Limnobacter sp.]|nr:AraC family transcriptional regulator ligand-binding domain-containing protein [Limnobacter sp.]